MAVMAQATPIIQTTTNQRGYEFLVGAQKDAEGVQLSRQQWMRRRRALAGRIANNAQNNFQGTGCGTGRLYYIPGSI
jgi:hypothetical protein